MINGVKFYSDFHSVKGKRDVKVCIMHRRRNRGAEGAEAPPIFRSITFSPSNIFSS